MVLEFLFAVILWALSLWDIWSASRSHLLERWPSSGLGWTLFSHLLTKYEPIDFHTFFHDETIHITSLPSPQKKNCWNSTQWQVRGRKLYLITTLPGYESSADLWRSKYKHELKAGKSGAVIISHLMRHPTPFAFYRCLSEESGDELLHRAKGNGQRQRKLSV